MKLTRRVAIATALAFAATVAFVATPAVIPAVPIPAAQAADPTVFDPGMIISDEVFYNSGSMNAGQIQSFLTSKGANCRANTLPCLKDFTLTWAELPADAYCQVRPAGSGSAATYFATVAASCGINPQVLLVLVEKEQSLVSRPSPTDYSYRHATGFACPDSGGCSDASAGFSTQVYLAARQYQAYRLYPTSFRYQAGATNQVLYHPDAARCGSSPVYIRNQATAGLYNYTPYQPNAAALNNLYGYGDACSSYGNRNFWSLFTDWFGNTGSLLASPSFERGNIGWGFVNGPLERQIIGPTSTSQSGQYYLSMYAWKPYLSISQDVRMAPQVRDTYTASIWVRSGSAAPHRGALTLWAMGGQQEVAQTSFTVGSTWTEITVTLPIARTGHTALRLEIYLLSTDATLYLDNTSLGKTTEQAPVAPPALNSPSFEEGMGSWGAMNGALTAAVSDVGAAAHHGTRVLVANAPTAYRSVGQDLTVQALRGESYTATVWVRASDTAGTVTGTFALWGAGSSTEVSALAFTVGTGWTPVTTTLTVSQASISRLRVEVYLGSAGVDLYLDDVSLVPNLAPNPSFEVNADQWNRGITHNVVGRIAGDPALPATDGTWLGTTGSAFSGGSIATDVIRRTSVGETYTATLWLRAANAGDTWDGAVALWGLGGGDEVAAVNVSIPDTWTLVTVTLPITGSAHSALRLEIYTGSPGETLHLDGIVIR